VVALSLRLGIRRLEHLRDEPTEFIRAAHSHDYQPAGDGTFPTLLTLHGRGANAFDLLGSRRHSLRWKFMISVHRPLETPIGPEAVATLGTMSMGGPRTWMICLRKNMRVSRRVREILSHRRQEAALLGFSQAVLWHTVLLGRSRPLRCSCVLSSWLPKNCCRKYGRMRPLSAHTSAARHARSHDEVARAQKSVETLRGTRATLIFENMRMA